MDYAENMFQAMDTIIAKRLSELNFDITDMYTVVKPIDKTRGIYQIEKNGNKYEALAQGTYNPGDIVYVTIPKGLDENTKIISGLKNARNQNELFKEIRESKKSNFLETAKGAFLSFGVDQLNVQGLNALKLSFNFKKIGNVDKIKVQIVDDKLKTHIEEIDLSTLVSISSNNYSLQECLIPIKNINKISSINLIGGEGTDDVPFKNVSYSLGNKIGYSTQEEIEELKNENQKTINILENQIKELQNQLQQLTEQIITMQS